MKLTAILVLALVGIAVAQTVTPIPRDVRLVGEIPAEWWTYIKLQTGEDGTPIQTFTVPAGRHLVVTRVFLGGNVRADSVSINEQLDGLENGTRVVLSPESHLTVDYMLYGGVASIWGYLEPVR